MQETDLTKLLTGWINGLDAFEPSIKRDEKLRELFKGPDCDSSYPSLFSWPKNLSDSCEHSSFLTVVLYRRPFRYRFKDMLGVAEFDIDTHPSPL